MKRNSKAQSAVEYLMTYGWMLLVVAIAGGAIFSIVGGQNIESTSGFTGNDINVENFGLSSNYLDFILRNTASEQVKINSISINDPKTGVTSIIQPKTTIQVSETDKIRIPGVKESDTSQTLKIEINYNADGLKNLTTTGSITGTINAYNTLTLRNARFNRTNDKLYIDTKNIGSKTTDSVNYTIQANNTEYTGNLDNLDPGQKTTINIAVDQTYPLELVKLDTNGPQFVDRISKIKCTPTKGLIGYWSFNDRQTKNGNIIDLSGYGNNGNLQNGIKTGVEGRVGDAYRFDGENDFIKVNDDPSLDLENLTITTLMLSNNDSKPQTPLGKGKWNNGGSYQLMIRDTQNIRFYTNNNQYYFGGSFNFEKKFHQVGITFLNSSNRIEWFYDGKNVGGSIAAEGVQPNNKPLTLGGYQDESYAVDGKIDETRLYNRPLSQSEIQRLYDVRDEDWAVSGCKLVN